MSRLFSWPPAADGAVEAHMNSPNYITTAAAETAANPFTASNTDGTCADDTCGCCLLLV